MPLVSVVIPTYNAERYLGAAIESVLGQTATDLEVVVVDDGSTDGTEGVVRSYRDRVKYLKQENTGVAVARNRGIAESRATYVAFLDADDTWLPGKLERQLEALKSNGRYRLCYAAHAVVDDDLRPLGVRHSPRRSTMIEDLILLGNVVGSICTVLCERNLFDQAGGFDPGLSQCADWEMWLRLAMLTDFLYLDEPLVTYRQHGTSMSRNIPLYERDSMHLLDKAYQLPGLPQSIRDRKGLAYGRMYMVLAGSYWHAGSLLDFMRCARRVVENDPRQLAYLLAFPWRRASRAWRGNWTLPD